MVEAIPVPAPTITPLAVGEALKRYENWQRSQGQSVNTVKSSSSNLRRLVRAAGETTPMHLVTREHFTTYMANWAEKGQGTRNQAIARARAFFKWARLHQYVSPWERDDPTAGWKQRRYEAKQGDHISPARWGELLDIAENIHPVYRIVVALGLYVMQRGPSEARLLQLSDFNLSEWKVRVVRTKTNREADWVPICGELRIELVKWLQFYSTWVRKHLQRDLEPSDYMMPRTWFSPSGVEDWCIQPGVPRSTKAMGNAAEKVLNASGLVKTRNPDGSKNRLYGSHAWRRIGARALFDELVDNKGYDGALGIVREMLGHQSNKTTEIYLNLSVDRVRRDKAITQNHGYMFARNDPHQQQPTQLVDKQLPAALTGGVVLGGASRTALDDADSAVTALPAFLRRAA